MRRFIICCGERSGKSWCRNWSSRKLKNLPERYTDSQGEPTSKALSQADNDDERGGSVCLNRFRAFCKWFSASVMPLPLRASAG